MKAASQDCGFLKTLGTWWAALFHHLPQARGPTAADQQGRLRTSVRWIADATRNARGSGASTHPGKQERVVKGQNTLALKTSSQKTRWLSWVTGRQLCPWGLKSQDLVLTTATDHLILGESPGLATF